MMIGAIKVLTLSAVSPSGDKIKVVVEGERLSLIMTSADGSSGSTCDNRPKEAIDDDLIALRLRLGLDTPSHMLAVPDRKPECSR